VIAEKQLIAKIRKLSQIKPKRDWVSLTKQEILGPDLGFTFFPYLKPALAGFLTIFILFGAFDLVKHSLPGDILYTIRKAVHKSQAVFMTEQEKPAYQLKLANDRLEDLTNVPVKNLAPTIYEFQANISEAARNLANIDATVTDPVAIKKIVEETKKLEENKQKVESLGVVIGEEGTQELTNALSRVVSNLIKDLGDRTLTEDQEKILAKMQELFSQAQYSQVLELYLISQ